MLPYPLTTTLSDINDDVVINTITFMALYKFLENIFVRIEMINLDKSNSKPIYTIDNKWASSWLDIIII